MRMSNVFIIVKTRRLFAMGIYHKRRIYSNRHKNNKNIPLLLDVRRQHNTA